MPTPAGFVTEVEDGDPQMVTSAWVRALAERGFEDGRLSLSPYGYIAGTDVTERAADVPAIALWLAARADASAAATGDGPVRHWPASWIDMLAEFLNGLASDHVLASFSSASCPIPRAETRHYLTLWHDLRRRMLLFDDRVPEQFHSVSTQYRLGGDLVGVAVGGRGLLDDVDARTRVVERFEAVLEDLASELDYAIVGVHDRWVHATMSPFAADRDTDALATARMWNYAVQFADRVAIDAGPVQLLGPNHRLASDSGTPVDIRPVAELDAHRG